MNRIFKSFPFVLIVLLAVNCKKSTGSNNRGTDTTHTTSTYSFAKGADISWLTQMEASGIKFYNASGTQQDLLQILKDLGMNAIRLRVWVNPDGDWNNKADVVAKAQRAKAAGMRLMIDFHYSDSWADPSKQNKPAAWTGQDFHGLKTSVTNHTTEVLNALKGQGIIPEWVEVGNEVDNGMLWPEGKASTSMQNFAQLITAGYDAVKAVDKSIKVIVHVSNGFDNSLFRWIFDGLQSNGAKWDVIGMSLYPSPGDWENKNFLCLNNMNDIISRYGKEIMISEVGMSWDQAATANAFLKDIITKTSNLPDHKGLGVFYWEPESYNNWQEYTLGAFDNSGKPTEALNAFK